MSHAALGIEVLFGENPADAPAVTSIRDFIDDPAEDELIRASIAHHRDFRLPTELDTRTRSFCEIVRDGDKIVLDVANGTLELLVDDAELEARKVGWEPIPARFTTGVLGKYQKLVGSASKGAVLG